MKIGLSFSRCVRDIFEGKVDMEDVLVIVARTHFDPRDDEQWSDIWQGYTNRNSRAAPEWAGYSESDQERFRQIALDLYETGRLHQPRQFGWNPRRLPYYWLETIVPPDESTEALKNAWEQYKILAQLTQPVRY
jgi:hypothetical protein